MSLAVHIEAIKTYTRWWEVVKVWISSVPTSRHPPTSARTWTPSRDRPTREGSKPWSDRIEPSARGCTQRWQETIATPWSSSTTPAHTSTKDGMVRSHEHTIAFIAREQRRRRKWITWERLTIAATNFQRVAEWYPHRVCLTGAPRWKDWLRPRRWRLV